MRLIVFLLLLYLLIRLGFHIFGDPKPAQTFSPWVAQIRWDKVRDNYLAAKENSGLVTAVISQQTGVSMDTLRNLEKGIGSEADLEAVGKIAYALGVEPEWFLGLSDYPYESLILQGFDQKLYPNGLPEIYDDYYDDDE